MTAGLGSGSTFPIGTTTVTYLVTDAAGLTASCSFTVTVIDAQAPVISCPGNITVNNDAGVCGAVVTYATPVGTDNCAGAITTMTAGLASGSTFPIGTTTITYLVTDAAGLIASCSFTVTVIDAQAPVISCPANITVNNDAGVCGAAVTYTTPVGTDNCAGAITTMPAGLASGSTFPIGTTIVTYLVTDAAGLTASCSFTVTVIDAQAPVISCPANIIVNNDAGVCGAAVTYTTPVGTDNCAGAITTMTAGLASGNVFPIGTTTVTYLVTDAAGLTASCSFTVTVIDVQAPVINGCPGTISLTAGLSCTAVATWSSPVVTDNCSGAIIMQTAGLPPGSAFPLGITTITYTAVDASGNLDTCSFIVSVVDIMAPMAVCQSVTLYLDASGQVGLTGNAIDGGSSDNCGTVNVMPSQSVFTCNDLGWNTVFLLVSDSNGNTAFCMTSATVLDTIAPTAICQNITVSLDGNGVANITSAMIGSLSTDNCGSGGLTLSLDQYAFTLSGTYPVVLTVTDASGNSSTCTAIVTVEENVPPVAICQNITVYLDAFGNATILPSDIDGGSYDNAGPVTLTASQTSFGCNNLGTNNVTLIVTDGANNQTLCIAEVTVLDNIAPTAICQSITVSLDNNGVATITSAMIGFMSTDNCGNGALNFSLNQYTFTQSGVYAVVLTVTDASGNSSSCAANVVVVDLVPPVAICQNDTIYLNAFGSASMQPADIDGGSSDNAGPVNLATSQSNFSCINMGSNSVTLIVTDMSGNQTLCLAEVIVLDTVAPTAICQNITVGLDGSGVANITSLMVGAQSTDNCGNGGLGLSLDQYTFSQAGTYTVTLTVTDASGNSSTCNATVTVEDNLPPVALCQNDTIYLDGSGNASIQPADIDGGSYDNAGVLNLAATQTAFSCNDLGSNNLALIVTDGSGNQAFCIASVLVLDTIAPTVACQSISIILNSQGVATIAAVELDNGSTDNCGSGSLLTYSVDQSVFTATGAYTVTLTVTDGSGNSSSCTATVQVGDNNPPTAQCQNATIYLDANGNASLLSSDLDGGSFDNGTIVSVIAEQTVFDCGDLGSNPVYLYVMDDVGNVDSCLALVTVLDTIAPDVICQSITVQMDANDLAVITGIDLDGGTTDNCGTGSLTYSVDQGNFTAEGTYTVTLTVTDASGNTSSCTAEVTVIKPQPALVIPSGFSPNGDGIADTWVIKGLEYYPYSKVLIFNRWGSEIFQASPYRNDWSGQVNAPGTLPGDLPSGTYFYQLELGEGDTRTGYLQVNR
jgi:gliding motility-associated-like protein